VLVFYSLGISPKITSRESSQAEEEQLALEIKVPDPLWQRVSGAGVLTGLCRGWFSENSLQGQL
jgi:hypothetical protein